MMIILNILMVKVTKFVILDDEHKESFESSLFRERRPPHNSQAKILHQPPSTSGKIFSKLSEYH